MSKVDRISLGTGGGKQFFGRPENHFDYPITPTAGPEVTLETAIQNVPPSILWRAFGLLLSGGESYARQ